MGGEERNHLKVPVRLGYTLVLALFSVIANTLGTTVVAVDISDEKLDFAKSIGATATVNASRTEDVVQSIIDLTEGDAHVSVDALASLLPVLTQ